MDSSPSSPSSAAPTFTLRLKPWRSNDASGDPLSSRQVSSAVCASTCRWNSRRALGVAPGAPREGECSGCTSPSALERVDSDGAAGGGLRLALLPLLPAWLLLVAAGVWR